MLCCWGAATHAVVMDFWGLLPPAPPGVSGFFSRLLCAAGGGRGGGDPDKCPACAGVASSLEVVGFNRCFTQRPSETETPRSGACERLSVFVAMADPDNSQRGMLGRGRRSRPRPPPRTWSSRVYCCIPRPPLPFALPGPSVAA